MGDAKTAWTRLVVDVEVKMDIKTCRSGGHTYPSHEKKCPECFREYQAAYYEENREKRSAANRARNERNRERCNAASRAWYERNREKCNAAARAWRLANPEKYMAAVRAWGRSQPGEGHCVQKGPATG